jgi:carboxyl-terminal processing protease
MKNIKKTVIIGLIVICGFLFLSFDSDEFKIAKSLDIYISLFKELNFYYVDDVNPEKLIKTSIDAMLESLDPYTTFIPESEMDNFKFQTTGQYGGIGALIRRHGENTIIAEPYENFPAAKAGLKAGDILFAVDGKVLKANAISDVSEMLKGTPGTEVEIKFQRPGSNNIIKKKLIREEITIPSVPYYGIVSDSIGYIKLSNFTTNASIELKDALIALKNKYAKSIILDLRNNPGGLLIEAVNVANIFTGNNQLIVYTKGRIKQSFKKYFTSNNPIDSIIPLVILVNRGSASASEIVAGSLQDIDRAVIVGQRTFGKGLVQQTCPLSYNSQLKVTISKYYIPSGRCIQALDYEHRNEDGSVGYIPDSLISEFNTRTGRKVYDGGGIKPDSVTSVEALSSLTYSLFSKNFIFDYATFFAQKHDRILKPQYFQINDSIYSDFTKFLEGKEFDYKSNTEEALNKMIEIAKREKYYAIAENEISSLKNRLSHDKYKDLQTFRNEISELLLNEIIGRYYFQKGKIEASLVDDKEVKKASEILKNRVVYTEILSGKANKMEATSMK